MSDLIHIGLPKTGTTWLQTCVLNFVKDACFVGPNKYLIAILSGESGKFDVDEIKKNFFETNKNIIYSDPELSGLISFRWENNEISKKIANNLKKLFPDAKILIVLRNQIDFIVSGYAYYVRKGGTYSFNKFFERIKNDQSVFSLKYLEYANFIEIYTDIFGDENVKVCFYEDLVSDKFLFLKKIKDDFDLDLDINTIDMSRKNTRLRKGLLHFIRFSNHFTKKEVKEKTFIFNLSFTYNKLNNKYEYYNYYKIFGSPIKNTDIIKDQNEIFIKQYFKESNKKLEKYISTESLKKYNYI